MSRNGGGSREGRQLVKMVKGQEHKVAIATKDGERIARHFRAAPFFIVYTVRKGRLLSAETRINMHSSAPAPQEGQAECWKIMEETLGDVRVVIVSGMGENAYVGLLRRDMLPLLTEEEYADRALEEYLRGRLREHPELVHGAGAEAGKER